MAILSIVQNPDELIEKLELIFDAALSHKILTTFLAGGIFFSLFFLNNLKNWYRSRRFFEKLNIPGPKPRLFLGNMFDLLNEGLANYDTNVIKKYGKTVGYFEGNTPIVLTTDTKFIKNVLIKDFNKFVNKRTFDSLMFDPLDKFLNVLKNDEWKNVRTIVTTAFTSGKLKSMSKYMNICAENFDKSMSQIADKDGIFNAKDFFSCFTLDVISTCSFGVSIDSFNDSDNEFIYHAKNVFGNTKKFNPKIILLFLFPKLSNYLAEKKLINFIPVKSFKFFEEFVNNVIERRKQKLEIRDDFIQNMLDREENEDLGEKTSGKCNSSLSKTLTNKEILAQSILFLLAGYETTANTLSYVAYNLAKNPDCQEKLCQEIDTILDMHDGKISYESVNEMSYMDKIVDETLRIFPPALRVDRVASEDYEYNGMRIKKGMVWAVPIWALHHDQDVYPDPYEFRPERFEESEKVKRDAVAFMPFSVGPRNCVGMRFALIEIKLLLTTILSKYYFQKCEKTPEKIEIDNSGFGTPTEPIYIQIRRR